MNDRFKFRVFLKYNQTMYDIDSFCYLEGLNKSVFHFKQGGQKTLKNDDFVLMQSTGLKDKNGKLIYEKDVVKIANGSVNGSVIETTREVKWTINTWNIPVWVVDKPNFSHYVEVIGNIYENKDLLNENSWTNKGKVLSNSF